MADDEPRDDAPDDEAPAKTPFDNPFFLPALLWVFALWFGYDGWLNSDEKMLKPSNLWFNRIGFPVVALLAIWFTLRGVRERREEREKGDSA